MRRTRYAQSRERHIKRWLYNKGIETLALYTPLIQNALLDWGEHKVYVVLDTLQPTPTELATIQLV